MTGYGRAEKSGHGWRCAVEFRSFNGRHLEIRLRLPAGLGFLDDPLKKYVKTRCRRGNVEGTVILVAEGVEGGGFELNRPLLQAYGALVREVSQALEQPIHVSLGDLLANRELIQSDSWNNRREELQELVRGTAAEAMDGMITMRETEGRALKEALLQHSSNVRALVVEMIPLTEELPLHYARKLKENLARLAEGDIPGEERILQEITIFAERCDVSEEFARLQTHLDHMERLLDESGAVGKKSEFLMQELNREANTLGVKCPDLKVSSLVIEMKAEIEKLREQIQNIE
jgi:uncharacterized protein (TIGR00255 family)